MRKIFILNGPNMNLLGLREPEYYGYVTLADIETACRSRAAELGFEIDFRQTNHEGELIEWIHESDHVASGLLINAAGYAHYSVALLDAVLATSQPVVEIHLSNIFTRASYRHTSYLSSGVNGVIIGFGAHGYELGLEALARILGPEPEVQGS